MKIALYTHFVINKQEAIAVSYPNGNLTTRAIVKPGSYTVIPPEGRVKNVIPHFEGFATTILASPKHGAGFVFSRLRRIYSPGCSDNNFANPLSGYRRWIREVLGFDERIRLKNVVPSKIRWLSYSRFAV